MSTIKKFDEMSEFKCVKCGCTDIHKKDSNNPQYCGDCWNLILITTIG
jgi:hypothetical protein